MRKTFIWSLVGTSSAVGFDLALNIFGGRAVLAAVHPYVAVGLPWIGWGILVGVARVVLLSVRGWDARMRYRVVKELEQTVAAGRAYLPAWEAAVKDMSRGRSPPKFPWPETGRWEVLSRKYGKWIASGRDEDGEPVFDESSLNTAMLIMETFNVHGYLRGRWKVREIVRERQEWAKEK